MTRRFLSKIPVDNLLHASYLIQRRKDYSNVRSQDGIPLADVRVGSAANLATPSSNGMRGLKPSRRILEVLAKMCLTSPDRYMYEGTLVRDRVQEISRVQERNAKSSSAVQSLR